MEIEKLLIYKITRMYEMQLLFQTITQRFQMYLQRQWQLLWNDRHGIFIISSKITTKLNHLGKNRF